MSKEKVSRGAIQFFAAVSYFVCTIQWFWFGVLLLGVLSENGFLESLQNTPPAPPVATSPSEPTSPFVLAIGGAVTLLMIAITLIVLVRLPKALVKTGRTVTQNTTQAVVPMVSHHKKLPQKQKRQLTAKVLFYIRLVLSVVPFALLFTLPATVAISQSLVLFVGGFLAILTLTLLVAESVLNTFTSVKKR